MYVPPSCPTFYNLPSIFACSNATVPISPPSTCSDIIVFASSKQLDCASASISVRAVSIGSVYRGRGIPELETNGGRDVLEENVCPRVSALIDSRQRILSTSNLSLDSTISWERRRPEYFPWKCESTLVSMVLPVEMAR